MDSRIDILRLFPELAAIDRSQLQVYCDAWRRRPLARQFAIAQIAVDEERKLLMSLDTSHAVYHGDQVIIPIDELLGYIIDQHFAEADQRSALQRRIRDARRNWADFERDYEVTGARLQTLYLTCKNPACRAELETHHQATEQHQITCPPTNITCPACGCSGTYDGGDLHFLAVQ